MSTDLAHPAGVSRGLHDYPQRSPGGRRALLDDLAALEETLAWLDSPEAIRRAADADAAIAAGDLTGRDEMAALMTEKSRRRPA